MMWVAPSMNHLYNGGQTVPAAEGTAMEAKPGFDSTNESLFELLMRSRAGHIQLPDFQRGWVWDDDHIKSLLASISLSYPIGAIMLLETGGDGANLKAPLF